MLAQGANPAEQMRVAAQLRQLEHPREILLEKSEEALGGGVIIARGSRESLKACSKDLLDVVVGGLRAGAARHRF